MPDIQAGIESSLWTLWTSLSGANLVHDVGYIESGLTCSYEMIVIGNEIIAYVHRLMDGFEINTENLALDLIHKIGPGGSYVETQHTLEHFREVWYPKLSGLEGCRSTQCAGKSPADRPGGDQRSPPSSASGGKTGCPTGNHHSYRCVKKR